MSKPIPSQEDQLRRVVESHCATQKGLDYVLNQKSNPQHRAVLLEQLRPYLKFVPAEVKQ